MNCVERQCGASDEGYDQRQGFPKIDKTEIRRVNSRKLRGRETR